MSSASVSPDRVLEVFGSLAPAGTPLTTPEVAAEFDCTDRTIYNKLDALVEAGTLKTKKVGARGRVWWRPVDIETECSGITQARESVRGYPVFDSEMVGVVVWSRNDSSEDATEFTIKDANKAFLEMVGLEYEEALDISWRELTPEKFHSVSEQHVEQVEETGSGVPYNKQYYHADGSRSWGLFESRKLNDTEHVEFVIDITKREQVRQQLEEEQAMFADGPTVVFRWTPEAERGWPVEYVSENVEDVFGYSPEELERGDVSYTDLLFDEELDRISNEVAEHSDGTTEQFSHDPYRIKMKDGDSKWVKDVTKIVRDGSGEIVNYLGYLVDITDRKETERELRESKERFRAVANLVPSLLWSKDPEGFPLWYNQQWLDYTGQTMEEACDDGWLDAIHPADREESRENFQNAIDTGEPFRQAHRIRRHDGEYRWFLVWARPVEDGDGEITRWFGAATDINDQRELRESLERLTTASRELIGVGAQEIEDRVARLTREVLDVEYTALWRYDETSGELREHVSHIDRAADFDQVQVPDEVVDEVWQTFIGDDVTVSTDLNVPDETTDGAALQSWLLVPLGRHGVLCVGSTRSGISDTYRVDLARTTATTVETAWDRAEGEQQLADRNAELEHLDSLNGLIRGIDQALVDAKTLEAIDEAVCELLADSALFEFVWIGERDPGTDAVRPREWAGVDQGYLDTLVRSTDQQPLAEDPIAAAARTNEVQVVADVAIDPRAAGWREATLDREGRSCISIPLSYNETVHGVLTVYAARPNPDKRDTAVLAELGETIAHAIDVAERRWTLLTDSVTELTLDIPAADDVLADLARETGVEFEFDGVVPQRDGAVHLFFATHEVTPGDVLAVANRLPQVAEITLVREDDSRDVFEATITEPSLPSSIIEQGGLVRSFTAAPGTSTVVVDVPTVVTVREFVESIQELYPGADLVGRHTRDRAITTRQDLRDELTERFTPRQREILEIAYRSGFFESPRVRTGRELSDALDITQSTFSHHLREAQRRLCELVFENT